MSLSWMFFKHSWDLACAQNPSEACWLRLPDPFLSYRDALDSLAPVLGEGQWLRGGGALWVRLHSPPGDRKRCLCPETGRGEGAAGDSEPTAGLLWEVAGVSCAEPALPVWVKRGSSFLGGNLVVEDQEALGLSLQ